MAVSLGHLSSEPADREVTDQANLDRVIAELRDCDIVVLCGIKARLLSSSVTSSDRKLLLAWHLGNQALNRKYALPKAAAASSSRARREQRAQLWATELLANLGQDAA